MKENHDINFLQNAITAVIGQKRINVSVESKGEKRLFLASSDSADALAPFLLMGGESIFKIMGGEFSELSQVIDFEAGNNGLHLISFSQEVENRMATKYAVLATLATVIDGLVRLYGIPYIDSDDNNTQKIDLPAETLYANKETISDRLIDLITSGGLDHEINVAATQSVESGDDYSQFTSVSMST